MELVQIDRNMLETKKNAQYSEMEYNPPSDPDWWTIRHTIPAARDEWLRSVPMDRPEQMLLIEAAERSGRVVAGAAGQALTGNEISAAVRLRGLRVVDQPAESRNADPSALGAILRAGAGALRK